MPTGCDWGRACVCSECTRCTECDAPKFVAMMEYGPRGGLRSVKIKCLACLHGVQVTYYSHRVRYYGNKCQVCLEPFATEHEGESGQPKDVVIRRECVNRDHHDISNQMCTSCNKWMMNPDERDGSQICMNCRVQLDSGAPRCSDCDLRLWYKYDVAVKRCEKCHDAEKLRKRAQAEKDLEDLKNNTQPKNAELGEYTWCEYKKQWESHWSDKWQRQQMRFGKYRGQNLEVVAADRSYCRWLRTTKLGQEPGPLAYMLFCVDQI